MAVWPRGSSHSRLQAPGAEGGQLATQLDHPLGQFAGDLVRTGVRGAGEFL